MSKSLKPFLQLLGFLAGVHVLCLFFLSLCRMVFLLSNLPAEGIDFQLLPTALLIGIKFDNLIACYLSALPFAVLPIWMLCTCRQPWYQRGMHCMVRSVTWYYTVTYAILLFVHIANARYFHFFNNHLHIGIFEWFGFAHETVGLVFGDSTNLAYTGIALVVFGFYTSLLRIVSRRYTQSISATKWEKGSYIIASLLCILLWGATFCGMRGSFQRYPLKVSFAYFSPNAFYNKLGVNPVFNMIKSAEYGRVHIPKEIAAIDENEALRYVQAELGFTPADTLHPLTRPGKIHPRMQGTPHVILIFMESMTSENLERQSNGQWLTPYLRKLRDQCIYWENCFSTGIHTNNGIVGVHYGFVPNFAKTCMDVNADRYTGLPYYLRKNGYQTMCFITGNPQYDNMNSFWRDNHIEDIYSLYDYPTDKAVNNFGVQDGYLFEWGLNKLEERSKEGKPMFATFLTVSNHGPYVVPEAYKTRGKTSEEQIIAYADDALKNFVEKAQQTDWGRNALFVLVADHGAPLPSPYEMTLPYNRIPVFIHSNLLEPEHITRPASQTDIWPSVLSMLGVDYENNSTGVDILNEERRYAYFVNDDHLGVSDGEWFWCYSLQTQRECLYHIGNGENLLTTYPDKAQDMREYGMKMQRVNLTAIEKKWTAPENGTDIPLHP